MAATYIYSTSYTPTDSLTPTSLMLPDGAPLAGDVTFGTAGSVTIAQRISGSSGVTFAATGSITLPGGVIVAFFSIPLSVTFALVDAPSTSLMGTDRVTTINASAATVAVSVAARVTAVA